MSFPVIHLTIAFNIINNIDNQVIEKPADFVFGSVSPASVQVCASSDDRLIPDLYHIILHVLILILFVLTVLYI